MSTQRTFVVKMPTDAGNMPYLDILVQGPVGAPGSPVVIGATATGKTVDGTPWTSAPPAGWQGGADFVNAPSGEGDGQFYEIRSRPLRIEQPFGAVNNDVPSFVPRFNLGYGLSAVCTDSSNEDGCVPPPCVLYSASLIGLLDTPFDRMGIAIPNVDPDYGAVIRLLNSPDTQGSIFTVHLQIAEPKDEDRSPTGGG